MEVSYRWAASTVLLIAVLSVDIVFPLSPYDSVDAWDGDPVLLDCAAPQAKAGAVEWTYQNQKLTSGFAKIFPNGTLLIQRANLSHAGLYRCTRSAATKLYIMAVQAKARVFKVEVKPRLNVTRGTTVTVACKGYGTLPIEWRWFQDKAQLKSLPGGRVVTLGTDSIEFRLNRSAQITCQAKNRYGNDSRTMTIIVSNGLPPKRRTTTRPLPTTTTPRPLERLLYRGVACKRWLPKDHRWAFGGPSSSPAFDLAWREAAVQKLLAAADDLGPFRGANASCAHGLKALLCGLLYPAGVLGRMDEGGLRKWRIGQLCREHCVAVDQLFCPNGLAGQSLERLRAQLKAHASLQAFLQPVRTVDGAALCSQLPQASRLQAKGVMQDKAAAPLCTEVKLERATEEGPVVDICYKDRGEFYRGSISDYASSRSDQKQPCALWSHRHAASVLANAGYSMAAFPSLADSGRACRNPAGLQPWPFCVPENPTKKTLVRCAIPSCEDFLRPVPSPDSVPFLGLKLSRTKLAVILGLMIFVALSLLSFCLYCCCCRHLFCRRSRGAKNRLTSVQIALTHAPSNASVIHSEFDMMDPKCSLLTPNQDYHGKALAEFITPKLQRFEYPREEIVDLKELGRGAFGEVSLVEAKPRDGSEGEGRIRMAMKVLKSDATSEMQLQFLREASLLADLEHDNIVRLMGVSLVYKPFCMLMEYMCHGDLNSYLRRHDPNSTAMRVDIDQPAVALHASQRPACNGHVGGVGAAPQSPPASAPDELNRLVLCKMATEIAEGMIYLSHQNFVHRDLATRNCLLDITKKVKIADFGLCRHIKRGEDFIDDDNGAMPVRWMPLEAILERRFNLDTDVWSFGVLLWELFSYALQPYFGKTHEEVIDFLQKGSVLDKPPDAPDGVYVLMLRCWSRQRRERPPFAFLKRQLSELLRRWTT